ncbi:hypothetical protein M0805_000118 [Coniferiporia weirii]|nr:hypothetical protein M0805_000118 [Coniferiporia weirii]
MEGTQRQIESEIHELRELRTTPEVEQINVSSLAPTDGGFKAWAFLAGAFLVEGVVWAFPTSFGALLNAYMKDNSLTSQPQAIQLLPLIGTFSSGIIYCSCPFVLSLMHRYPRHRRTSLWVGLLLCWISLFGASYTSKVNTLLILQGFLYAVGGSLLYAPCVSFLSEWFVKKRGLANGVMFSGTATGGLFLPLILPRLISSYGTSKTLRILSIAILVIVLPAMPFLRPRLPESRVHAPEVRSTTDLRWRWSWIKDPVFMTYLLANTIQGLAYFLPFLWLPTFATELSLSDNEASLALSLINGFSALGMVAMGSLSDRISPWILALSTALCTSFATFILWGVLSRGLTGLLAYGISYGILAGGWSSMYVSFVRPVAKDNPALFTMMFGALMFSRGVGNILSTPISTALSNLSPTTVPGNITSPTAHSSHPNLGFDVAGGRYASMILYVGTCFAGAGFVAMLGWGMDGARARRL